MAGEALEFGVEEPGDDWLDGEGWLACEAALWCPLAEPGPLLAPLPAADMSGFSLSGEFRQV